MVIPVVNTDAVRRNRTTTAIKVFDSKLVRALLVIDAVTIMRLRESPSTAAVGRKESTLQWRIRYWM